MFHIFNRIIPDFKKRYVLFGNIIRNKIQSGPSCRRLVLEFLVRCELLDKLSASRGQFEHSRQVNPLFFSVYTEGQGIGQKSPDLIIELLVELASVIRFGAQRRA